MVVVVIDFYSWSGSERWDAYIPQMDPQMGTHLVWRTVFDAYQRILSTRCCFVVSQV